MVEATVWLEARRESSIARSSRRGSSPASDGGEGSGEPPATSCRETRPTPSPSTKTSRPARSTSACSPTRSAKPGASAPPAARTASRGSAARGRAEDDDGERAEVAPRDAQQILSRHGPDGAAVALGKILADPLHLVERHVPRQSRAGAAVHRIVAEQIALRAAQLSGAHRLRAYTLDLGPERRLGAVRILGGRTQVEDQRTRLPDGGQDGAGGYHDAPLTPRPG